MTDDEALEVARSVVAGKPTEKFPACAEPFSYVRAAHLLAQFVIKMDDCLHEVDADGT